MFKNYFTIAVRTLLKNKVFTGINILGLSIGISASLVIYLLVNYHFSFDKFEKDNSRIYRVTSNFNFSGEIYHNQGVCDPMAGAIRKELTGLDAVVPFRTWDGEMAELTCLSNQIFLLLPIGTRPNPMLLSRICLRKWNWRSIDK